MKQIALDIGLNRGPSLHNFLAGPNAEALQHVRLWAGSSLRSPVPIYLWGESGSGKSHLLRAAAQALGQRAEECGEALFRRLVKVDEDQAAMVAAQTDSAASQGDLIDSIADISASAETLDGQMMLGIENMLSELSNAISAGLPPASLMLIELICT
mgnify:CR=1 FL=1